MSREKQPADGKVPGWQAEIYQELQDYLYEMTYTVPVAYPTFAFGAAADVQGFNFASNQIPDLTTVSVG